MEPRVTDLIEQVSRAIITADGGDPDAFITKADQAMCDREGHQTPDHAIPLWRQAHNWRRAKAAVEAMQKAMGGEHGR